MSAAIFRLTTNTNLTAEQTLHYTLQDELSDVLIAGYDKDGELIVRSSRMTRAEALFLAEKMKDWAINGGL